MKMFKRIVSLLLAVIISFSATVSVSANSSEAQLNSLEDYKNLIFANGYPTVTTEDFYKVFNAMTDVYRLLTGKWIFPKENFNIEIDDFLTDVTARIAKESGLDFKAILNNLPETNGFAEVVSTVLNINTVEMRKQFHEMSDKAFSEGNGVMGFIYGFIGVYFSVIEKCEIYSVQSEENPDIYEIYMRLHYKDGGSEDFYPGLLINTVTGECTNVGNDGIVGTGFNFNLSEMVVYATVDCWMRDFGFCVFYDVAANSMPWFFNYNTRRFMFEYNGLEYMIQIWKGNYTIANGAEVGVYCREPGSFGTYYDCVDNDKMLMMSMQLYHDDKLLLNKGPELHWWCNGFALSKRMYLPSTLTMKFSIEMADEEMLNAFTDAIDSHFMNDVTYTVDGLTVNAIW